MRELASARLFHRKRGRPTPGEQSLHAHVSFRIAGDEAKMIRELMRIEDRDGATSPHLWTRELLRQYLHEYRVDPSCWPKPAKKQKRR